MIKLIRTPPLSLKREKKGEIPKTYILRVIIRDRKYILNILKYKIIFYLISQIIF